VPTDQSPISAQDAKAELETLTPKQHEFMKLACRPGGMTTKEIALALSISPSAVDQRAKEARRKLGVEDGNTAKAVQRYILLNRACGDSTGGISQVEIPVSIIDLPRRDTEREPQSFSLPSRRVRIDQLTARRRLIAIPLIAFSVLATLIVMVSMAVALAPRVSELVEMFGG